MKKNPLTEILIQRLSNLSDEKKKELGIPLVSPRDYSKLSLAISKALTQFGFPKNHPGTEYLKYAIFLIFKDPFRLDCYTSNLYPIIGKRFNATPASIEKAIRNSSTEMCKSEGTIKLRSNWFYTMRRPSNTVVMNVLIKYILEEN